MKHEFKQRYARTTKLSALFAARRSGCIARNELRMFCAILEAEASRGHHSIDWVINAEGNRRMTSGQQQVAIERLTDALEQFQPDRELTNKIPRPFLVSAARGRLKSSEIWAGLFYYSRRMPQRKHRKCLVRTERYARFTLAVGAELLGMARSTLCEALQKLRRVGLISRVWRPMHELKRFGALYVDGPKMSLSYEKHERSRSRPWFSEAPVTLAGAVIGIRAAPHAGAVCLQRRMLDLARIGIGTRIIIIIQAHGGAARTKHKGA